MPQDCIRRRHRHVVDTRRDFAAFLIAAVPPDRARAGVLPAPNDRRDKPSVIVVPVDYRENVKLTKRLGQLIAR